MNIQEHMPLYKALHKHIQLNSTSFHVPGHKNGLLFQGKPNILAADITEISGMDDLYHPTGIIMEAQQLLTSLYQSDQSLFLVGGSTVGNLSMIYGTCTEGDTVLVQRNCHKSIIHGLILAKVEPVFMEPEYDYETGIAKGVAINTVKEAVTLHPHAKAIILTYPNYYGMVDPIQEVIQFAHSVGLTVLVDEAHGAHFIGNGPFPHSSFELGADVVVQSAHKTLPTLTMGAFLHIREGLVDAHSIKEALSILQTSSPSYLIMASLDFARSYLGTFSNKDFVFWEQYRQEIVSCLHSIQAIECIERSNDDPLKLTIRMSSGESGQALQRYLEGKGIFPELSDPKHVLLIFPLFKMKHEQEAAGYLKVLKDVLQDLPYDFKKRLKEEMKDYRDVGQSKVRTPEIPPYQVKQTKKKWLSLSSAVGHVSGGMIIPYPPGIPLLMPGEAIQQHHIQYLHEISKNNIHVQGDGWDFDQYILVLA